MKRSTVALTIGLAITGIALACGRNATPPTQVREESRQAAFAKPAAAPAARASLDAVAVSGRATDSKVGVEGGANEPTNATAALQRTSRDSSVVSSMIIRSGNAGIEVDSLDRAIAQVRALATRVGGYVANTAVQSGRDQIHSATLELKIPATRFDEALTGLTPIGKVEGVNVSAEDVGEEYVDVNARVANAHKLEARLIELLATRTGKLQDVLSVERELARVREEIERYEGRLRFLRTRAATSSLSVTVHEHAPIIEPNASGNPIVQAGREAWRNFVGFIAAGVASLGYLIPLALIAGLAFLGLRRVYVTEMSRRVTRTAAVEPPAA
jgi:hypothetical protein